MLPRISKFPSTWKHEDSKGNKIVSQGTIDKVHPMILHHRSETATMSRPLSVILFS